MAAPYIIGIDPATSAGICEGIVGKTPTLLTQRFRGDTHEQMFGAATAFFAKFLKDRSPDLVAVEALTRACKRCDLDRQATLRAPLALIALAEAELEAAP